MILVMTTCAFVGGTFAKYITTVDVSDKAVVAYWGFGTDNTDIDLFAHTDAGSTVAADRDGVKVIAPGTEGSATLKFLFTEGANGITAPEVAYKIAADVTAEGGDNNLLNNTLMGMRFKLTVGGDAVDMGDGEWGFFNDLERELELAITGGTMADTPVEYKPGELPKGINKDIVISWEWPFDADESTIMNDEMQTSFLGNEGDTITPIVLNIKTTITQVD